MLTNVAALVWDSVAPFEMGLLYDAFGVDRTAQGVPLVEFALCAPAREVRTGGGYGLVVDHDLGRAAEADLVAVAASQDHDHIPDPVVEAIRAAHSRGARVLSVCSGAFALGEAGLLDDRDCTTHWLHTEELAGRFPRARVVPEVLYVDTGPVVTSAGSAAGLDACLHVWRQEYGAAVASAIARRMVVPPHRSGGQAQYIRSAVVDCEAETLGPLLTWIVEHLDEPLSVDVLAREAHLSPRTFARRFRAETGTTPHAWITAQRVLLAEELLESTERPVERVAADVGFGNAAALRHHFVRARGVSPLEYRRTFCPVAS